MASSQTSSESHVDTIGRDVSILVVTYRNVDLTRQCLQSLRTATTGLSAEILVLDNASNDGTAEMIASEFIEMSFIPSQSNLGFAGANNELARHATGDYLLLINPDTVVPLGTIEALLDFARQHPEGGLFGGRTLKPSGALDPSSCWGAPTLWSTFCFSTGLSTIRPGSRLFNPEGMPYWKRDSMRQVDIVTGCLALISRTLWNQLGGFDEDFWLYGEDADLSMRVRALGYRPLITPTATITHVVGASSQAGNRRVLLLAARLLLIRKHWPPFRVRLARVLLILGVGLRASLDRQSNRGWREAWSRRAEWLG